MTGGTMKLTRDVETAGQIIRHGNCVMVYGSYTYLEPKSITYAAHGLLYTIVHYDIRHGGKKDHGSHYGAMILESCN